MGWKDSALVVTVLAVMAAVFAIALFDADAFEEQGPFEITYDLDGGENDPSNPSTFDAGEEVVLKPASRDGMVFTGWFSDPDRTLPCPVIKTSVREDVILYAGWDVDLSGTGCTYEVTGYTDDGIRTTKFSGEQDVLLLYYSPYRLSYYVEVDSRLSCTTYRFNEIEKQYENDGTVSFWASSIYGKTKTGEADFEASSGKIPCDVFTSYGDNGLVVRTWEGKGDGVTYAVEAERSGFYTSMKYKEKTEVHAPETVDVSLYGGSGVKASFDGTPRPGSMISLDAEIPEGSTFLGWFDSNGDIVSREASFDLEVTVADVLLYARISDGYDLEAVAGVGARLSVGFDLEAAQWSVEYLTDGGEPVAISGPSPTYVFTSAGEYSVKVEGTTTDGGEFKWALKVLVEGVLQIPFEWIYEGETFSYALDVAFSDYLAYREAADKTSRSHTDADADRLFATPSDPYVKALASFLSGTASDLGLDEVGSAEFVLCFVQALPSSEGDEWHYPLETLFLKSAGSADSSILYCSLMGSLGYDTALLLFPGHTAAGLSIDGVKGVTYTYYGIKYRYCESDRTGFGIGEKPEDVDNRVSALVEIPAAVRA